MFSGNFEIFLSLKTCLTLPQLQSLAVGCLRQLSQRNPKAVSVLGEQEFPKGLEEKLFELFDVPDGIQLNEVRDTLNFLLSARFKEKTEFWMTLVREVFQASHAAEGTFKIFNFSEPFS